MSPSINNRTAYIKALSMGRSNKKPLPILDDILLSKGLISPNEAFLGLCEISINQIVGTKTESRGISFNEDFMPIMDEDTEFACKWMSVFNYQSEHGISDAIEAYEFMNKFYILEGNKRVSVLKFIGASSVLAKVTRLIPPYDRSEETKIYYEYMDFYRLSEISYIYFDKSGDFSRLQRLVGKRPDEKWNDDDRMEFRSFYIKFENKVNKYIKDRKNFKISSAILKFISICDYKEIISLSTSKLSETIDKYLSELRVAANDEGSLLLTEPVNASPKKKSILSFFLGENKSPIDVGFLFPKTPQTSSWTMGHSLGMQHLGNTFSDEIRIHSYENVIVSNAEEILQQAIADGCSIIFATSPVMLNSCIKVAVDYPEVKILNCSLNSPSKNVRTYHARVYEAKFLLGAIAGCLSENGMIGYMADYPVFGSTANINAFAMGAKLVNPRSKVYLQWLNLSAPADDNYFQNMGIKYISGRDNLLVAEDSGQVGLFCIENNRKWNVAIPVWNWGAFYERMIQDLLNNTYDKITAKDKGINYFWGLSANVAEVITSKHLPIGTLRLVNLLKDTISRGDFMPFSGDLYSQSGLLHSSEDQLLNSEQIISMDYLVDNVVGSLPRFEELNASGQELVEYQGLIVIK